MTGAEADDASLRDQHGHWADGDAVACDASNFDDTLTTEGAVDESFVCFRGSEADVDFFDDLETQGVHEPSDNLTEKASPFSPLLPGADLADDGMALPTEGGPNNADGADWLRRQLEEKTSEAERLRERVAKQKKRQANTKALLELYRKGKEKVNDLEKEAASLRQRIKQRDQAHEAVERELRTLRLRLREAISSKNELETEVKILRAKQKEPVDRTQGHDIDEPNPRLEDGAAHLKRRLQTAELVAPSEDAKVLEGENTRLDGGGNSAADRLPSKRPRHVTLDCYGGEQLGASQENGQRLQRKDGSEIAKPLASCTSALTPTDLDTAFRLCTLKLLCDSPPPSLERVKELLDLVREDYGGLDERLQDLAVLAVERFVVDVDDAKTSCSQRLVLMLVKACGVNWIYRCLVRDKIWQAFASASGDRDRFKRLIELLGVIGEHFALHDNQGVRSILDILRGKLDMLVDNEQLPSDVRDRALDAASKCTY